LELAEAIIGYQILPEVFIAPAALVLPLVEIWAALAVLFAPRPYRRAGAAILLASLVIFVAAAAQGLIRGLDFDCGCFGPSDGRKPGLIFFLQDGGLILACALVLIFDQEKPSA
jgi:hypothetical protein